MNSKSVVFITTHDVDLALKLRIKKLLTLLGAIKDSKMNFDYKIKDGVIKSTNALRILEIENLDLDLSSKGSNK